MSKIVVEELETSLEQDFITFKDLAIEAVRPYLFKWLSPAGTFTISLIQNSVMLGSKSLTSADIENNSANITATNFAWGPITFRFNSPIIVRNGTITVKLEASGYTFSESAWIGWVRPHLDRIYEIEDGQPLPDNDFGNPMMAEFWSFQDPGNHS